ncbi:MAG TPA: rhodanese-like domain-containing protein [Chloroflexia bacterium]|nr:rhodanese-like domain-containing protein [Chloroflexia bacterium]
MSQRPRDNGPARSVSNRPQKRPVQGGRRTDVYVPQKRDPFPYIMGGVIGALVVGLMLVIFLLTSRNNTPASTPVAGGGDTTGVSTPAVDTTPPVEGADAPRITMEDFKKLYDSPDRPLIIDVRPVGGYDAGHIRGAISFPETDVDTRINELPKDKLVIAYCA